MKCADVKEILRESHRLLSQVETYTQAAVGTARILLNEDDLHELQDSALQCASKISTIESDLHEFVRFGTHTRKFVVGAPHPDL